MICRQLWTIPLLMYEFRKACYITTLSTPLARTQSTTNQRQAARTISLETDNEKSIRCDQSEMMMARIVSGAGGL